MKTCLMCNQLMKLEKKFESKKCKTQAGKYRVRRFTCTLCDYSELITANGGGEKIREQQALSDQKKYFNQQSENQI